jgi:hypothetical protein
LPFDDTMSRKGGGVPVDRTCVESYPIGDRR